MWSIVKCWGFFEMNQSNSKPKLLGSTRVATENGGYHNSREWKAGCWPTMANHTNYSPLTVRDTTPSYWMAYESHTQGHVNFKIESCAIDHLLCWFKPSSACSIRICQWDPVGFATWYLHASSTEKLHPFVVLHASSLTQEIAGGYAAGMSAAPHADKSSWKLEIQIRGLDTGVYDLKINLLWPGLHMGYTVWYSVWRSSSIYCNHLICKCEHTCHPI